MDFVQVRYKIGDVEYGNYKNYESATSFNNLYDIFRVLCLAVNYF